jgi:ribosomal protein S18 acetylase RimI-like enzyme
MDILNAGEFNHQTNAQMSRIFVDGFYQWLRFFSKDKAKLVKAFTHMFNPSVFYIATVNEEILGIAACTGERAPSVRLDKKEFRRHLGLVRGFIAYTMLKKEFEGKKYPFPIEQDMGLVEFVAVAEQSRRQGVAAAIISHIFDTTPYAKYVLEVADTNASAVRLYEKLGFQEFMRVKLKHSKRSGVNDLVYMKYHR